ncbi:hypothetical protein D1013_02785 [Euzebyella marina]|uniref:DNA primase n=1 Tax=Euzebyella marina TaxID=1761453 RepID=A0A3G2L2B6_9FLAO|nr:hypothetical protein [Euzebyella marina]AYN66382.1 hypothetical protein D1013_02785 [Euzebyella marina]MBG47650.1 hypothetical protein [Pseudozobellia sp.]|tara:strand:- start:122049 stop:122384 length:336 start_codon:yes stop_codon:yes gene_type:complete
MSNRKDQSNLKRVIVDFKKLTPEVLKLLVERYPDGYDDRNIISFKNAQGERIEAVEVLTEDTKYLVKISAKLEYTMENYDEDDYEDYDDDDPDAIADPDPEAMGDVDDDDD